MLCAVGGGLNEAAPHSPAGPATCLLWPCGHLGSSRHLTVSAEAPQVM